MDNPEFPSPTAEEPLQIPSDVLAILAPWMNPGTEPGLLSDDDDDTGLGSYDLPELTDEQLAQIVQFRGPRKRVLVSVRLDPSVIDWLKSKGEHHLTRINDILLNLMEAERKAATRNQP